MVFMRFFLLWIVCFFVLRLSGQTSATYSFDTLRLTSGYTAFPDTGRLNGHRYDGVHYIAKEHYSDSTVLVLVPRSVKNANVIPVVCWFHGWYNTVDSANQYFALQQQFIHAAPNAIFIIPEMARNAPDSYGGKLVQNGMFTLLLKDLFKQLSAQKIIQLNAQPGDVVLAGHSGAYSVMMHISKQATVPVRAIFLFDGLYRYADEFTKWMGKKTANKWVHWYTHNGGGTDEESEVMMQLLVKENIPFKKVTETDVTDDLLNNTSCLFIESKRLHNDVIARPANFYRLIKSLKWLY
jgi:hypothetical protein